MTMIDGEAGAQLSMLLSDIAVAEANARLHDGWESDRFLHAALAQSADERACRCREAARALIEAAFPGVSWAMVERASLQYIRGDQGGHRVRQRSASSRIFG